MFTIEIEDGREAPLKPGIDIFFTKFIFRLHYSEFILKKNTSDDLNESANDDEKKLQKTKFLTGAKIVLKLKF